MPECSRGAATTFGAFGELDDHGTPSAGEASRSPGGAPPADDREHGEGRDDQSERRAGERERGQARGDIARPMPRTARGARHNMMRRRPHRPRQDSDCLVPASLSLIPDGDSAASGAGTAAGTPASSASWTPWPSAGGGSTCNRASVPSQARVKFRNAQQDRSVNTLLPGFVRGQPPLPENRWTDIIMCS